MSQVKASKLTDKDITRKVLGDLETAKLEDRLEELKKPINLNEVSDNNDDNDDDNDDYGGDLNQIFNELRYGGVRGDLNKDLTNLGMAEYNQRHRHVIYQLIDQFLQSHHPV